MYAKISDLFRKKNTLKNNADFEWHESEYARLYISGWTSTLRKVN